MRSLVLDIEHRKLEERDLAEPSITQPNQVLFRVHEVGVCGTDREMATFRLPRPAEDVPHLVVGHEALGQVIETGSEVSGFERGDWVVPMIRRPCYPPCTSCARGRPDLCLTYRFTERGIFGVDGYFTEKAVDEARDLIRIPERLISFAILMEPMSVVEKAIARVIAVRQTDGNSALVLGLGPIGMLSAMVLRLRGFRVRVFSLEPADHPRVRILASLGIEYLTKIEEPADVIVEAAGSAELVLATLRFLGPAGVFLVLGAKYAEGRVAFVDLLVGNQTIIGSVNANAASFAAALQDLQALPSSALNAMIQRFDFGDYRRTLFEQPGPEPKYVHVI
jgi:threonine dehydrogenase-like Zn-dependent dehydrogenase